MHDADTRSTKARNQLHHVGVIVPSFAQADEMMQLLGLEPFARVFVDAYDADCIFTGSENACIEFIVPRGGKLAQFNGGIGGIHHIAIEVPDLEAWTESLKVQGIELLEKTPVRAGKLLINFLPPIFTRGSIVEYVQRI